MVTFTHFFSSQQKPMEEPILIKSHQKLESAQQLLASIKNQFYVTSIKKYARAPEEYFMALYLPLIEGFAEITQCITENLPSEQIESDCLLNIGLSRCAYAMLIRHRMHVPQHPTEADLSTDYGLWTYVIFSSALLWKIGKLITHYKITLSNDHNTHTIPWHPLLGAPRTQDMHNISFTKLNSEECHEDHNYSLLIAQHFMPIDGFLWIANNPRAMAFWLAALNEDTQSSGQIGVILSLADHLYQTQCQLNNHQEMLGFVEAVLRSQPQETLSLNEITRLTKSTEIIPPVSAMLNENTTLGKEFLTWLKTGILNKTILVNAVNSSVHMTAEGVFLLFPQIFIDFCTSFPKYVHWIVVYKQFNYLGLSKKDGNDMLFDKFFGTDPEYAQKQTLKRIPGIILNNTSLLFNKNNQPNISSYIINKPNSQTKNTQYPLLNKILKLKDYSNTR